MAVKFEILGEEKPSPRITDLFLQEDADNPGDIVLRAVTRGHDPITHSVPLLRVHKSGSITRFCIGTLDAERVGVRIDSRGLIEVLHV